MRIFLIALLGLLVSNSALGSTVVVKNNSDWDIHFLYLSPTSSDDWGPDQLGEEVIESGGRFKLKDVECDTYDVLIVDEDSDECELTDVALCIFKETWEIDNDLLLSCQDATQGVAEQADNSFTLHNGSQWSIFELYLSPSDQSTWGEDLLGADTFSSGETRTVSGYDCGTYDVRLVDEDGDVCEFEEYFCGDEGADEFDDEDLLDCQSDTQSGTQNNNQSNAQSYTRRSIKMYNSSQWSIFQFYLSQSGQPNWGEDILGTDTWSSGDTLEIWDTECGRYDLRLIDEDDDVCQLGNIYLCHDQENVTLTDELLMTPTGNAQLNCD